MADAPLLLRDIHQPPAPPWWPPAPGWWLLAAAVLLVMAGVWWWRTRRRRRRAAIAAVFDNAVMATASPTEQIAAMSELLRRAARQRDPEADRLQGEAWLAFLDAGSKQPRFTGDNGRLLLEGGYRRGADPRAVAVLRALVRSRFLEWMAAR